MAEQRLIDANKEVIRAYEDIPEPYSDVLISFLRGCEPIDPESLPIVQQLREALSKAVAEKETAEALLAEYSGVDFCKTIKTCFGYPLDKVQQLVEADKEGRCVVFPCKPSDVTVYQLRGKKHALGRGVHPRHISCAVVWSDGRYKLEHQGMEPCRDVDFGKTWFLSEEEAKAASTSKGDDPDESTQKASGERIPRC